MPAQGVVGVPVLHLDEIGPQRARSDPDVRKRAGRAEREFAIDMDVGGIDGIAGLVLKAAEIATKLFQQKSQFAEMARVVLAGIAHAEKEGGGSRAQPQACAIRVIKGK